MVFMSIKSCFRARGARRGIVSRSQTLCKSLATRARRGKAGGGLGTGANLHALRVFLCGQRRGGGVKIFAGDLILLATPPFGETGDCLCLASGRSLDVSLQQGEVFLNDV